MKRNQQIKLLLAGLVVFLGVSLFLPFLEKNRSADPVIRQRDKVIDPTITASPLKESKTEEISPAITKDLSANLMKNYGAAHLTALDDLLKTEELLQSYFALIKVKASLPVGENSEITTALTGKNPYRIRFLDPDSPWINEKGELTDRWGTALYFHPVDVQRIGIRSGGVDKKLWTEDDLITNEDADVLSTSGSSTRR